MQASSKGDRLLLRRSFFDGGGEKLSPLHETQVEEFLGRGVVWSFPFFIESSLDSSAVFLDLAVMIYIN
jgi:hypothetical protein